jgi:hypothetical protein
MVLLVAGILSPNTNKIQPPIVANQPRIKYTNGSVPHTSGTLVGPSYTNLWYTGKSTSKDFRRILLI